MANTLKFGANKWAAKEGSVLAFNDENNNFKPLPFSFTRASSATRVNESGLIESVASGVPRIDFLDNADGHLLLEPSRSNYVLYSETEGIIFGSNGWAGNSDTVITRNYGTTPFSGTELKSTRFQFAGASKELRNIFSSVTIQACASVWVKGVAGETIKFGSSGNEALFTLSGEWQKLVKPDTVSQSCDRITFNTFSGATARDIEIYAPQLEAGSYATSYIPTSGSSVTRAADNALQNPVSGIIGQTEGAFFVEFQDLSYSYTSIARIIAFSDGTSTNRIYLAQLASGAMYFISTGGAELQESAPSGRRGVLKVAVSYANNNYKLYVNGVLIATDTSATVPACNRFYLGGENGIDSSVYKPYNQVKVYNTALSDAELIALTS